MVHLLLKAGLYTESTVSLKQNILPFVYHTSAVSNLHPVSQQMLLDNSCSLQRRIPMLAHCRWAFENVFVKQPGVLLLQDPPSKLQHLTAPDRLIENGISWVF